MISSLDICDPRILQSDWLRGLYRKIDNNINFYLRSFSAKIKHSIFQNGPETPDLGYFDHFRWFYCKWNFSKQIRILNT